MAPRAFRHTFVLICLSAAAPAMAGTVTASSGFDYSSGKYGTSTTTDIWEVPLSVGYDTGSWRFKLTVPYINIAGASNVIPGVGTTINTNPSGRGRGHGHTTGGTTTTVASGSASGLGDVTAKATYQLFYDQSQRFGMDLSGKIKFGTADQNKGLGTGQNDYRVGVDAYKGAGNWTLFGGVGYTDFGSSAYIPLSNGADANAGAGYRVDAADNLGAFYYYRQRISNYGYQRKELTGYWNHHFDRNWELQVYALTGLSDGSPDWGGGAMIKWRM